MATTNTKLIVVLGMHRSGTSAITRGLEVLGVNLGSNLQAAMPSVNDKGFFEDNDIVSINEGILLTISHEWHTLLPIERSHLISESLSEFKLRAIGLLREKMKLDNVSAIKDPRICRLLPFWQDVFDELDINVSYVIVIRNPLSVAESLNKRNSFEKEKSYFLWLEHVLPSILETSGSQRVVVNYDNMMEQPDIELARIAKALDIDSEFHHGELIKYKSEYLSEDLRHTKFDINDLISDPAISQPTSNLYRELVKVAMDVQSLENIEVLNCAQHAIIHLKDLAPALNYMVRQDWKIAGLNNAATESEERIAILQHRENELRIRANESRIRANELSHEVEVIYQSKSWRITRPMRVLSLYGKQFMRFIRLYLNYRQKYPGIGGLRRLSNQVIDSIQSGGVNGLRSRILIHEQNHSITPQQSPHSVLVLDDLNDLSYKLPEDVAVHAHIYYPDLAPEIREYLLNIPVKFHCYITTDTLEKSKIIETVFYGMKNIQKLDIRVVENRGRDLAPMIVTLGAELARHEIVLHIHSKRSPHNPELRGWRRYLMMSLLGNTQRVTAILHHFTQNEQLGMFFPQTYRPVVPFMRIGGNKHNMVTLLNRMNHDSAKLECINLADFPSGSMFWFRGKALEKIVQMQLTLQEFDVEKGQCDGTLAHAIERLLPYFANINGMYHQSYLPRKIASSQSGAVPLSLLNECCAQGKINSPVIIFDHNIGGGANRYSRELMNAILIKRNSILRTYHSNGSWFIEMVEADDGMIFVASDEEDLFETFAKVDCSNIIINSLYGYPDVEDAVFRIIRLAKLLKADLDYKMHDFYAICPSQHLLNLNGKYCGVPSDYTVCNKCLNKNPSAYWASKRDVDISNWRDIFIRLFEAVDVISVFDSSTIEILSKAFRLDGSKFKSIPHGDDYFKCNDPATSHSQSCIGVLGTLTIVKGAATVNELSEYIKKQGTGHSIVVVGKSLVPTMPGIKVLGPYDNKDLPEILRRENINVILMPTIVPETFSYTISEAIKMRLPIVAFDIGAQGNRVSQYLFGKVIPLDSPPEVVLSAIQSALKMVQEFKK